MANAKIVKEIVVETQNKVGMLAEVTGCIAGTGANIQAICAYAMDNDAIFMLIVDNNQKAISGLKTEGYKAKEDEVIILSLTNKVGTASEMARKFKEAGIDLSYIYGSTGSAPEALMVIKANNNAKALEVLK